MFLAVKDDQLTGYISVVPGIHVGAGGDLEPMRAQDPVLVEDSAALHDSPGSQEVAILHDELPVVTELVIQCLQELGTPFDVPFLATVTPSASPLAVSPRIANADRS